MSSTLKPETIALHGGQKPTDDERPAVPIYQTTSYVFNDTAHARGSSVCRNSEHLHPDHEPTTDVFEQRVAQLEGARALAVASGQAARRSPC